MFVFVSVHEFGLTPGRVYLHFGEPPRKPYSSRSTCSLRCCCLYSSKFKSKHNVSGPVIKEPVPGSLLLEMADNEVRSLPRALVFTLQICSPCSTSCKRASARKTAFLCLADFFHVFDRTSRRARESREPPLLRPTSTFHPTCLPAPIWQITRAFVLTKYLMG